MNSQLRQHKRYYFLLLGLLVGALLVGFSSAQATQLRSASSGVLAAPTPNPAFVCTVVVATVSTCAPGQEQTTASSPC